MADLKKRYLERLRAAIQRLSRVSSRTFGGPPTDQLGKMVREFLLRSSYAVGDRRGGRTSDSRLCNHSWHLQDEQGARLSPQDWWKGFIHALKARTRKAAAIPVHLPEAVAEAARNRVWMFAGQKRKQLFDGGGCSSEYYEGRQSGAIPQIEPLAGIGEILSLISSRLSLSSWGDAAGQGS